MSLRQDTIKTSDETNKAKPGEVEPAAVQLLLGEVYARQDRFDDAIATYDQVSQANPQDFRPVLGKAIVLRAQGKTSEAEPLFTSAAALAPPQFKDQITKLATASPSPSPTASPAASPESSPEASPATQPESSPEATPESSPAP